MKKNVLIVRRKFIAGKGFRDDIIKFTNGIGQKVKYAIVDGVKRLVPVGIDGLKFVTNIGLNKLQDVVESKLDSVKGSGFQVNNRRTVLNEISKHLNRKTGGMIKSF